MQESPYGAFRSNANTNYSKFFQYFKELFYKLYMLIYINYYVTCCTKFYFLINLNTFFRLF